MKNRRLRRTINAALMYAFSVCLTRSDSWGNLSLAHIMPQLCHPERSRGTSQLRKTSLKEEGSFDRAQDDTVGMRSSYCGRQTHTGASRGYSRLVTNLRTIRSKIGIGTRATYSTMIKL
jgi:hypothetical protein